ncbi:hypothetical protein XELAEV_18046999mg [Xenopus laevis]|uniref:Uncharacterized protein n=1 Tax=Xenopus laevis TaxID=8355 RepID=A0A974BU58_XENLA|nr:hypothetical protein XELAEV_18046999mg [Xenopus laevis]
MGSVPVDLISVLYIYQNLLFFFCPTESSLPEKCLYCFLKAIKKLINTYTSCVSTALSYSVCQRYLVYHLQTCI